jgi:hypothetical protein
MRRGAERLSGLNPGETSQAPIQSCRMKFFTRFGAMPAQETSRN